MAYRISLGSGLPSAYVLVLIIGFIIGGLNYLIGAVQFSSRVSSAIVLAVACLTTVMQVVEKYES